MVVGSDRPAGADLAFASGAEVVLLDDGFQHLPLARDLDIVLLDADQPLANGRIFPAGPLRDSPAALNRADAFILTRAEDPTKAEAAKAFLRQAGFEQPIWTARHIVDRAVDPADGRPLDLSGKKIALVCGLARPDQAARSLEKLGPASIDLISLADHQVYDQALVRRIEDRTAGADLVIATAKDWVKLRLVKELSRPIGVTDLRIEIDQAESLKRLVLEAAAGRGRIPGMVARRPRRKTDSPSRPPARQDAQLGRRRGHGRAGSAQPEAGPAGPVPDPAGRPMVGPTVPGSPGRGRSDRLSPRRRARRPDRPPENGPPHERL